MESSYNSSTTKPLYRGTQIIWYVLGSIEVLLWFRLILKLLGANADAVFTDVVYKVSYVLVAPFMSVFSVTEVAGRVFEWTTLLAIFVYWVLAIALVEMLIMSRSISTPEAAVKLNNQDK